MRDEPMTYSTSEGSRDGILILRLDGPLTLSNLFALQSELRELKPHLLIFDLSQCPYIDSAGLGVLMNYYVSAQKNGRKLALAGLNQRIEALLELTRVNTLLNTYSRPGDAESEA